MKTNIFVIGVIFMCLWFAVSGLSYVEENEADKVIRDDNPEIGDFRTDRQGNLQCFVDFYYMPYQWWQLNKGDGSPIVYATFQNGKTYNLHKNRTVSIDLTGERKDFEPDFEIDLVPGEQWILEWRSKKIAEDQ